MLLTLTSSSLALTLTPPPRSLEPLPPSSRLCLSFPTPPQIRASLHAGFATGKSKALAYRKYQLLQLGHLLKENRARFVEAIHADMSRPAFESELCVARGSRFKEC